MRALKDFFSFSKKELDGLLVLSIILILVVLFPSIYSLVKKSDTYSHDPFKAEIDRFLASEEIKPYQQRGFVPKGSKTPLNSTYFSFNPNHLPGDQWRKLGLSDRQIQVIRNFESKGGHFYRKDDLKKIYSITPEQYARLEPFIDIPRQSESKMISFTDRDAKGVSKPVVPVELNEADSTLLETIRGIGPAFASRIIKYRNRLGGFHSIEQLREVYGVDSARYELLKSQFIVNSSIVKRININVAEFEDLKRNPYLTFKQMNAIIQYRKQHGNYSAIEDLRKILILDEQVIRKLEPYLQF